MGTIGERIQALRKDRKLTLQDVALSIGKGKGNVSDYERGKYEPSANTIIALSALFSVSTDYILKGTEDVLKSKYLVENTKLSKTESEIIDMYRVLDERDQEDVYDNVYCKYQRASNKKGSAYSGHSKSDPAEDEIASSGTA